MSEAPRLAYFWGDDEYALDQAAEAVAAALAREAGAPPEQIRARGEAQSAARVAERVATAPLFGGGTVLTIVDPAPLVRSKPDRDALVGALSAVAPGNALVFLEPVDASARRAASLESLRAAVADAGGTTRELRAPREGQMAAWVEDRARERGLRLGAGAARELAERVGAFVRDGDVDRRRMGRLAVAELDKLGLYRPGGPIERDDVRALVAEAVPASTWAFLDAVGGRRVATAAGLLDSLADGTPEPVLVAQLHRRLRELVEVLDRLDAGVALPAIARALRLKEFRARRLAEQARAWTVSELVDALDGLLDYDALVKGFRPASDRQRRLALQLWLRDRVGTG